MSSAVESLGELRARLAKGPVCNGWLMLRDLFAAELMAASGWDSLTIDLQHGLHDYGSMLATLQALRASGVPILARVPWNEPGIVGKVLDAGLSGLICPMVNTARDAEALVSASRYAPLGARSNGPLRAAAIFGNDYQPRANDEVVVLPQVETKEAVDNLDAILAVPGIDGVYIGPSDLALTLGLPPVFDPEDAAMLDIFSRVAQTAKAAGRIAAIHCQSPAYAVRMMGIGFGLVTVGSDAGALAAGSRSLVAGVRKHSSATT